MIRKCLGCGQRFDKKMSICQFCFNAVESIRGQFDSFPKRLQKTNLLISRKFMLWLVGFLIVIKAAELFLLPLTFAKAVLSKQLYNNTMIISNVYLPIVLLLVFGLYLGKMYGRYFISKLIKQWINKEWYSVSIKRWQNMRYWLSALIPPFILMVITILTFYFIRNRVLVNLKSVKSVYVMEFYIGLGFGIRAFFSGLLIGYMLFFWFNTGWVSKLSK